MTSLRDRRPPISTAVSAPDVFCRPMEPGPAPLVFINGQHGIGKQTVAECLTLLLGKDKSLLIDLRSVGHTTTTSCRGIAHRDKRRLSHQHDALLTPEHPHYFSFSRDASIHSPTASSTSSSRTPSLSSSTTFDIENLTRLLAHPANAHRVAVLQACAPDTAAGRATLRTFEHAAARAGRELVCVELACGEREAARRQQQARDLLLVQMRVGSQDGGGGVGNGWEKGCNGTGGGNHSLAAPLHAGLTVDVTSASAFEAVLRIVEFVRGLEAERDMELCGSGGSRDGTTPVGGLLGEGERNALGLSGK
ncbi:hypothetical protein BT67DRAFT_488666 [Trichocladium antarcticum]|uniref:Uncharacterized protein n=1 Tax=Trichocladium antarcticum TaxID=1450529 RepID=A0AAN6UPL0_9PEZI|nr:hypothetical protein BT67DRAFT_488666 [Trichocladium antarcticum]